jgi:hypothetical protein
MVVHAHPPPPHPPPSPHPPWLANHAPEEVERVSGHAILAGFLLGLGLAILSVVLLVSRSRESDTSPNALGETVTLRSVAADFPLSWSPGRIVCRRRRPLKQGANATDSAVYGIVWGFLIFWLWMCAVYLILVGSLSSIEVFRGSRHAVAGGLVGFALALCATWSAVFRLGSKAPATKQRELEELEKWREHQKTNPPQPGERDWTKTVYDPEPNKKHWISAAAFVLILAYVLAATACGVLQPWTLPGEQYGTLLFLAPGYGLFAGWLLFAASLNFGMAVAAWSSPEGTKHQPEADAAAADGADGADTSQYRRTYPDSWIPLIATVLGGIVACACLDPTQMVPTLFALTLFVKWTRRNQYAAAAALFFLLVAGGLVYAVRAGHV